MKILKNLAIVALLSTFALSCEKSSPAPEVAVKKPDPTTPADTTKKDTTKVVVVPPTPKDTTKVVPPPAPISPKVIAGQKCYEAKLIFVSHCGSTVVQVLNDSIGIKSQIGHVKGTTYASDPYIEKEYLNVLTLKVPDDKAIQLWLKTGKVYFTVQEFVDLSKSYNLEDNIKEWGMLYHGCLYGNSSKIALKGAILSSYSNESCKP